MFTLPPAAWQPPIRLIKPRCWLSSLSCRFSLNTQFHDLAEGRNGTFMLRAWRLPESSQATSPASRQAPVRGLGWAAAWSPSLCAAPGAAAGAMLAGGEVKCCGEALGLPSAVYECDWIAFLSLHLSPPTSLLPVKVVIFTQSCSLGDLSSRYKFGHGFVIHLSALSVWYLAKASPVPPEQGFSGSPGT